VSNVVAFDAANAARVEDDRLIFPAHLISQDIRDKIEAYDDDRWFWQDDEDVDVERVIFVGDRQTSIAQGEAKIDQDADNPYGYLRRALSYDLDGTDIIIETEDATVIEALHELEENGATAITSEYAKPEHVDTIFIDKSGFELYRQGDEFIRFPSLWLNVSPEVDTALSMGWFHVDSASALITADIETEMVIEANLGAELPEEAKRQVVYDESYKLAPLGIIPVSLNLRVEVGCEKTGGPVNIEGGVHLNSTVQNDVRYVRERGTSVEPSGTISPDLIGKTFHVTDGEQATLSCIVDPDVRLLYFGMPIASLDLDGNLDLDMTTPPDALDAQFAMKGNATGLLSVLSPDLEDEDVDFIDIDKQLWSGPLEDPESEVTPRPFEVRALGDRLLR
jgi:hypothetical protein